MQATCSCKFERLAPALQRAPRRRDSYQARGNQCDEKERKRHVVTVDARSESGVAVHDVDGYVLVEGIDLFGVPPSSFAGLLETDKAHYDISW